MGAPCTCADCEEHEKLHRIAIEQMKQRMDNTIMETRGEITRLQKIVIRQAEMIIDLKYPKGSA